MADCKILLVDDDVEDYLIVKEALADFDAADVLVYASGGQEAVDFLNDHFLTNNAVPELIVLDINMPVMDGPATLRHIRADERFTNIPIVIYSTSINSFDVEKCMETGPCFFITKPSSMQEIMQVGEKLLGLCNISIISRT